MEESTSQPGPVQNHLVGQRIGSYRILDFLGSGGMSSVYRAVHVETGHEVALKVLLGALSRSSTLLQRFLREARSAENLEHANIVTIYDRGVDQGRHYLVLEYVAGGDFHDYVQRNGPLGVVEALAVIRGIVSGLRYAHSRGLIHRDIKPSNILRTANGEPKIIDLGLALQSEFENERVTREGTTVGTVDYMAPEQARDSRATSIHSDMYSLGCTFYYLLAGVPPYPGGDITEKLTRHARAPAPDIRDLRPDIPADVAAIILRLMRKQPEDRYADYDQLIAAIDAVGRVRPDDAPAIALAPLDDDEEGGPPSRPVGNGLARIAGPEVPPPTDEDSETLLAGPLDGLSLELADERESGSPRPTATGPEPPLPRMGRAAGPDESDEAIEGPDVEGQMAPRPGQPLLPWILATSAMAILAIVLAIGLHLALGGPRVADVPLVDVPRPDPDAIPFPIIRTPASPPSNSSPTTVPAGTRKQGASTDRTPGPARTRYDEPEDREPIAGDLAPTPADIHGHRGHLPEWTRSAPTVRPEDPTVVVRRVPDAADGLTEPSLNLALNRINLGTVEVADVGPLAVDDLYMSGESRVIRARRGYRPIIRIQRSRPGPALEQTAFFVLKQKSLTIEGIDFIVDARDLSGSQTALFGCVGSNLTLRDCTITVLNPTGARFTLIRQEDVATRQDRAQRPSRIWLDRSLVRGRAFTMAELAGGPVDLVLDRTAIIEGPADFAAGGGMPVVRVSRPEGHDEQRIFLAGSIIACPGPVFRCEQPASASPRLKPLVVRSDGSAFGRLNVPGIGTLISSTGARTSAERQVTWSGDSNDFAGWKGFFARSEAEGDAGPTVTVDGLKNARSTWNATEQGSEWIIAEWLLTSEPTDMSAFELKHWVAAGEGLMAGPARPNVGLFPKTIDGYPPPTILNPSSASSAATTPPFAGGELVMSTSDPRWGGDLGAFLRGLPPGARHVRVRVTGSGTHRFSQVRLPDGMTLEVRVEAEPTDAGLPSWSPDPRFTGPGMIALRDGALVLSNVLLRHDPASKLESLLALEDSHVILSRCQFTVRPDSGVASGDLITFRAPTTRAMPTDPGRAIFQADIDWPICRLIDTVLIANRTALRAELGRGLVALSGCAVASDETAIQLDPGRVARSSFAADLWLDRCTIVAARSVIGLGHWPGVKAGPDRPWVLNSRRCLFATLSDVRSREASLLRVDADAYAGGVLFWQADGDAFELDRIVTAGETAPMSARSGEWFQFWAGHHRTRTVNGPRAPAPRFRRRPRPGRIEPSDLVLEPPTPGQGGAPGVGADPLVIGSGRRSDVPSVRQD